MRPGSVGAVFAVTLAMAAMPLACGESETSPGGDSGSSGAGAGGAGAPTTGGSGATGGEAGGGIGGEAGGGNATSGGTSGRSGTGGTRATGGSAGTGGRPTGGESGSGGEGGESGAPEGGTSGGGSGGGGSGGGGTGGGGMSGRTGGGEGGEGGEPWTDEATERLKRICENTRALNCTDYSRCVEMFRWRFFWAPYCGPTSEQMLICLDTKATIEDFTCVLDQDGIVSRPDIKIPGLESPCYVEYGIASGRYCV